MTAASFRGDFLPGSVRCITLTCPHGRIVRRDRKFPEVMISDSISKNNIVEIFFFFLRREACSRLFVRGCRSGFWSRCSRPAAGSSPLPLPESTRSSPASLSLARFPRRGAARPRGGEGRRGRDQVAGTASSQDATDEAGWPRSAAFAQGARKMPLPRERQRGRGVRRASVVSVPHSFRHKRLLRAVSPAGCGGGQERSAAWSPGRGGWRWPRFSRSRLFNVQSANAGVVSEARTRLARAHAWTGAGCAAAWPPPTFQQVPVRASPSLRWPLV